jgi:hypothetical protein
MSRIHKILLHFQVITQYIVFVRLDRCVEVRLKISTNFTEQNSNKRDHFFYEGPFAFGSDFGQSGRGGS